MILKSVHFLPNVSIVANRRGKRSDMQSWDRDKDTDIRCEEQKNGDVWLTSDDGARREVSALAIAWKLRVPDVVRPSEPVRVAVDKQVRS